MALDSETIIDGKYQIVRLLGEGGMGAVYEGVNTRIHRRVAIKVLHGNVAGNTDAVQRFEREAQAAGRIGSKHIVEVLDMGDLPSGDRFMVMEFLAGQSLSDRIKDRGRMTPQELCPLVMQLLEGLAAAHAAGIVHRDLKPDNVFLLPPTQAGAPDFVKILDFGISKFNVMGGEFSMTRTGAVMGTPYYMSPEQAKGDALDQRTDLYAVGVILYEALSGRVPFNAETFNQLLFKIVLEEAPPLEPLVATVNPAFLDIVRKAMARNPDERYQTASDFKAALHLWSKRDSVLPLGIPDAAPGYGTSLPAKTISQGTTSPAWASTGTVAEVPTKKANNWMYGLAALILLGGGVAAYQIQSSKAAEREAAARAESDAREKEAAALAAARAEEERRVAAAKVEAEAARERLRLLEEEKSRAEKATSDGTAPEAATPGKTETARVGKNTATKAPTSPASPAKPAATATPATSTATKPASTTSTGRSIRSTL